jgi:hypothetical protein
MNRTVNRDTTVHSHPPPSCPPRPALATIWSTLPTKRAQFLAAETVIAALEDAEDYQAFEAAEIADYDAETAVERELVLRLASVLSRLRRASGIETVLFEAVTNASTSREPEYIGPTLAAAVDLSKCDQSRITATRRFGAAAGSEPNLERTNQLQANCISSGWRRTACSICEQSYRARCARPLVVTHGKLCSEFVGRASLAFANASDLQGMEGIELEAALALLPGSAGADKWSGATLRLSASNSSSFSPQPFAPMAEVRGGDSCSKNSLGLFYRWRSRSRTPGPPPFSSMNSTPAHPIGFVFSVGAGRVGRRKYGRYLRCFGC